MTAYPILPNNPVEDQPGQFHAVRSWADVFNAIRYGDGSGFRLPGQTKLAVVDDAAGDMTVDFSAAPTWAITLVGDTAIIDFDGAVAGEACLLVLLVAQDDAGAHSLVLPSSVVGAVPVLDSAAGATTQYAFVSRDGGVSWIPATAPPAAAQPVPVPGEITIGASGPSVTIDPIAAELYDVTMDQDCQFVIPTVPDGHWSCTLIVRGPFTPSFDNGVEWTNNSRPTGPVQARFLRISLDIYNRGASVVADAKPGSLSSPDAPIVVTASPTSATAAHIAWEAPLRDGGATIDSYTVLLIKHSDDSVIHTESDITDLFWDTGNILTAGVLVDVYVFAINSVGFGPYAHTQLTTQSSATVPGAVRNLVATPGDGEVTLTYLDPVSDGGAALDEFIATGTQSGGGATTPSLLHSASTTTTVPVATGTPRRWSTLKISSVGDVATSNALPNDGNGNPVVGSLLVALIFHGTNSQTLVSSPGPGWTFRARMMDISSGPYDGSGPGSGGADVMGEIWTKVADGSETGALTWTYAGTDTTYRVQVIEIPGVTFAGASGVLSGGVYYRQAVGHPTSVAHATGASPTMDITKNYLALAFVGLATDDSPAFDSGYTVHTPASGRTHVATKTIAAGTGGTTSTTATGADRAGVGQVALFEVAPSGAQIAPTFTAATAGSKLVGIVTHREPTGRTIDSLSGWTLLHSIDDDGVTAQLWRKNAVGGETSAGWIISGSDLAAEVSVLEFSGVGASSDALNPGPVLAALGLDMGLTGTLADKSLVVAVAGLSEDETVNGWTADGFTETINVGSQHVAYKVLSGAGTVGPDLSWATPAHAVAFAIVWDATPTGYTEDITTADETVHTIVFPSTGTLVNGISHTFGVRAHNSVGEGPTTTVTATPIAPVVEPDPGAGGITAVRAALGNTGRLASYLAAGVTFWNGIAPVGPIPWGAWHFNVIIDTDVNVARNEFSTPSSSVQELRIGAYGDQGARRYTVAEVNAGLMDNHLANAGAQLQAITVAQGRPQMIRPFWEGDGTWFPWSIDPTNVVPYCTAIRRILSRVKAGCPTVELSLCTTLTYGDQGFGPLYTYQTRLWDAVMANLGGKAFGGLVDHWSVNAYSRAQTLAWYQGMLDTVAAKAIEYGTSIAHSEWGIGDRGGLVYAATPVPTPAADAWADMWIDWWASLPVSGPGRLHHILLYDYSIYPGTGVPTHATAAGTNTTTIPVADRTGFINSHDITVGPGQKRTTTASGNLGLTGPGNLTVTSPVTFAANATVWGVLAEGLGVAHVPDPVGDPDGLKCAARFKVKLA